MRARIWLSAAAFSIAANLTPSIDRPDTDGGFTAHCAEAKTAVGTREELVRTLTKRDASDPSGQDVSNRYGELLIAFVRLTDPTDVIAVPEAGALLDPTTGLLRIVGQEEAATCYDVSANSSGS